MQAYRVEKVIPQTGKIELDALPFAAGAVVKVIILGPEKAANGRSHSLKGTVIKYDDPFAPVADNSS